jgi:hypothetical protein
MYSRIIKQVPGMITSSLQKDLLPSHPKATAIYSHIGLMWPFEPKPQAYTRRYIVIQHAQNNQPSNPAQTLLPLRHPPTHQVHILIHLNFQNKNQLSRQHSPPRRHRPPSNPLLKIHPARRPKSNPPHPTPGFRRCARSRSRNGQRADVRSLEV